MDHPAFDTDLINALERLDRNELRFGDAHLIVTALDRIAADTDTLIGDIEQALMIPAGTFDQLDELALAERV